MIGSDEDAAIDTLTALRRRVFPAIHRVKRRFGGYAECTMHPSEYVGTVERTLGRFRSDLRSMGFHREPIAALKCHRDGRESAGSWVRRGSTFADEQLHVTVFCGGSAAVDAYAHWEYSWITHPYKHYRAVGWDTDRGVTAMRTLLSEYEVPYCVARD